MKQYLRAMATLDRDVRLALLVEVAIGMTVFGGVYTVLLNLYLLRLGFTTARIGLVNGVGYFSMATLSLGAGALGVRLTLRRSIIVGVVVMGAGLFLLPFADLLPIGVQFPWVLATYFVAWLGLTLYLVNVSPCIMEATTAENRTHAFSARYAVVPLAAFLGSLVGGALPGLFAGVLKVSLSDAVAYRYPLILAALFVLPVAVAVTRLSDRAASDDPGELPLLRDGTRGQGLQSDRIAILLLSVLVFVQVQGEGSVRTFFNVYLDQELRASPGLIGTLSAAGQLLAVPAALLTPALARRSGPLPVMIAGTAVMTLSVLFLALVPNWAGAGSGFVLMIVASSVVRPAGIVFQQSSVTPRGRPAMSGATTMTAGLGFFAAAYLGGLIAAEMGFRNLFLLAAALTAVAVFFMSVVVRPTVRARS